MDKRSIRPVAGAIGVDGCRAGWFYFQLLAEDRYDFGVLPALAGALGLRPRTGPILVDVPIGLLDGGDPDRGCDSRARALLGPRAASVFTAPTRPALAARDYAEANRQMRLSSGQGLSRQAFNIMGKLREADVLMQASAGARRRVREAHPEIGFWALAGEQPMQHPKKTQAGFEERLGVLSATWSEAEVAIARAYLHTPRAHVARDDILDALVLALTARVPASQRRTLPPRPRRDAFGLPMQMVYGRFATPAYQPRA